MQILAEKGYLIPAVNSNGIDYVNCASALAESIKRWHPEVKICLLTDKHIPNGPFDYVKLLPHGDLATDTWKLSNDWQVFEASPFRETIKLEADMVAASPIDHWWRLLENRDVVISIGCRDFRDNNNENQFYRKVFAQNNLPDVYNAITYWRMSLGARLFFQQVKDIFEKWEKYKTLLKFSEDLPTTDVVYAMAAVIIGTENVTLPTGFGPSIVHMKKHIIGCRSKNWTKELVWEIVDGVVRINTKAQWGFFHYHIKDWANEYRHHK